MRCITQSHTSKDSRHSVPILKPCLTSYSIIRILFMVPVYSTAAFLQFTFYWHSIYFRVLSECYEAFAIASFFALMCHYLAPDLHEQKRYFRTIQPVAWVWPLNWFKKCCGGERGCWRIPRSGLTWFNVVWVGVYQYCFVRVAMTLTAVATQFFHRYCESSNSPLFGHIWVLTIGATSVAIAMYCLIQFYVQLRTDLAPHRPFLKVLAIKLVIFLSFWQIFTISILVSQDVLKPTKHLSYPSLKIGIPSLMLCIEMACFALMHLWAFPWQPYRSGSKGTKYPLDSSGMDEVGPKQGGFLGFKAFIDAMNPWDLVKAFARSMRWLFVGVKHRETDSSYRGSIDINNEDTAYKLRGSIHLPIADEFRRSRFGLPRDKHSKGLGEGAGLIANAQPNPLASSPGYVPARERYNSQGQDINPNTHYNEENRSSQDIGIAVAQPDPYQSAHIKQKRQQQGHNTIPSTQWAKPNEPVVESRPEIHNALWGAGPGARREG